MIKLAERPTAAIAALLVALFGTIASIAVTFLSGTKTGLVLALASIGGPILAYGAVVAPLIFPFTFYVVLVPFDNVLDFSSFGTMTKLLAGLSGAAILFYLIRTRKAIRPHPTLFLWLGLYLWAATTAFWAIDQDSVFSLLPTSIEILVLYAAIAMLPTSPKIVQWLSLSAVGGGIAAAAYGAYMFRHGMDIGRGDRLWISSATSTIDPNHFAGALIMPIALAIGIALYARKPIYAIAATIGIFVMLEGVAVTASRGAMIGIGAALLYVLIMSERRWKLALVAIPAAVLALFTQPSLIQRFATAVASGGSGRTDIWKVGMIALKNHWLLGAGYNNFAFAYDQVNLQAFQLQYAGWHRAPHNLIINTAVELGVVGLALMLWAWYSQFRMLSGIEKTDPDYPIRLGLEAGMVGSFVAALFLDVMVMKYVWLTFMLMLIVRNAHTRKQEADYA